MGTSRWALRIAALLALLALLGASCTSTTNEDGGDDECMNDGFIDDEVAQCQRDGDRGDEECKHHGEPSQPSLHSKDSTQDTHVNATQVMPTLKEPL